MSQFSVVRGKRVRVTELDSCGVPVWSTGQYVVSEGMIQVVLSSVLEAGDEYIQKNADGRLCINERAPDNLKRLNVTIDWCDVCPDLVTLITGYPQEMDGDEPVGFRVQEGLADKRWALELWTGLGGNKCGPDGEQFGYLLVPNITGSTLGDITVANAATTFQSMGYTEGFSGWGVGPFDVIGTEGSETPLDVPIGDSDHALLRLTSVPPPEAACEPENIPEEPTSP